jgi:hypothetical protein
MTTIGTAPRGTFRCGCGARALVTVEDRGECFGMAENGERCRFSPVRESMKDYGVSLCRDHLEGYCGVLKTIAQGEKAAETVTKAIESEMNEGRMVFPDPTEEDTERERMYAAQSVVYYIRIGDVIKIGTTKNMKARMSQLIPDEILATEPGSGELENMRHKQFRHLRVRGERFRPEDDLLSHIRMILEHYGPPMITGYVQVPQQSGGKLPADAPVGA